MLRTRRFYSEVFRYLTIGIVVFFTMLGCVSVSFQNVDIPVYYGTPRDSKGNPFPAVRNRETLITESQISIWMARSAGGEQMGNNEERTVRTHIENLNDRASITEIQTNVWMTIDLPWVFGMATQKLRIEVDHPGKP